MPAAAVSAVHALALITLYSWNPLGESNIFTTQTSGDPDLFGLFPILAVSGVMLTPILMWSSAVREHHGQAVILSYALFLKIHFQYLLIIAFAEKRS